MTTIEFQILKCPDRCVELWRENDSNIQKRLLPSSKKLLNIRNSIEHRKANRLGETRFLAEAFVSRKREPDVTKGWYGSYSWLGAKKWTSECFRSDADKLWKKIHEEEFHKALKNNICLEIVKKLQVIAGSFSRLEGLKIRKGPDLFFVYKNGQFEFIEAKLSYYDYAKKKWYRDKMDSNQYASLALLQKCLSAKVTIVRVCPERIDRDDEEIERQKHIINFTKMYERLERCMAQTKVD
ncbi:MAG: hypothetical protein U9R20_03380 [Thermodesulfobacteriota bacterium]|nr:hypothetical protein [Thermodesulfobacteriota bacterium]